jgi:hypothetical protein
MEMKSDDSVVRGKGAAGPRRRAGERRAAWCAAALAVSAIAGFAFAQQGEQGGMMQQKMEAIKQSAAMNKMRLRQYQWTETVVLTLKGDTKPPRLSLCHYGPDGSVQKTPIGPPPDNSNPGGLRGRIRERKIDELKGYLVDAQQVVSLYVPPDPMHMQQAFKNGNASLTPGGGLTKIVFKNYAKPNDQMTLSFDMATKKMASLRVSSYMSGNGDPVDLSVTFATLPDGTSFPAQTVLSCPARQIQVTTTNSSYQKLQAQ